MARLRSALALAITLVVGGPRSHPLTPIVPEAVLMRSSPAVLDRSDPARTRVGALTLVRGWRLDSASSQFGGWSALHIDGANVTMLGDAGAVLRFRLGRFGHATDARISPLPRGCGTADDKRFRDSESITGDSRTWWVGFEFFHRVCRVNGDFTRATGLRAPPQMRRWARNGGAEAFVRLADGRFLAFAERPPRGVPRHPLLVFSGDPTDPRTTVLEASYRPPEGTSPTDAAQLPDGRIVVLNRRFTPWSLFSSVLVVIDPRRIAPGTVVEGRPIARFESPLVSDNFEGLAVTTTGGRTSIWMLSDDNSMNWQATYLLEFALDPGA